MRKRIQIILAALLGFSMTACAKTPAAETEASALSGVQDGVYEGVGTGHGGEVNVEVEIKQEKITQVSVKEHQETAGISDKALETIPAAIVETQSLAVDTVSGATESSNAILEGAAAALTLAKADIEMLKTPRETTDTPRETIEKEADIVVIGGGAAGLTAAIEASADGANVILIEKTGSLGGSTALSEGRILAADSVLQREQGIEDSPELFADFMISMGDGLVNEDKLRLLAENSSANINWLIAQGVSFSDEITTPNSAMKPNRGLIVDGKTGVNLIKPLEARALEQGVEILLETRGTHLIVNDGVIAGVQAEQKNADVTLNAPAVILATGGYDRNPELMQEYSPTYANARTNTGAGNTGDGLIMAREIGANIIGNDSAIAQILPYGGALGDLFTYSGLFVSVKGERFMDESSPRPVRTPIVLRETGAPEFFIILDNAGESEGLNAALEDGSAYKADTLEALASLTGMDAELLTASVNRYNELASAGNDEDFGKAAELMSEVTAAPYYAVRCTMNTAGTFGGPQTNLKYEVLNTTGQAIPGLYAAGEVSTGDLINKEYPGSGTSIANCINSGRIAAASALAYGKTLK